MNMEAKDKDKDKDKDKEVDQRRDEKGINNHLVNMAAKSSDSHSSISLIVKGRLFGFALKRMLIKY